MNNQSDKPMVKKPKLESDNIIYCKFECRRPISKYRKDFAASKICCEWCSENNKGIPFDPMDEDAEHEPDCQLVQISKYDIQKYKNLILETNEFWLLFKKRMYRSSGSFMRFALNINALYELNGNKPNKTDDIFGYPLENPYDGILIKDLHSMYIKHKDKLKEMDGIKIEEFEIFFDCYQYGDGVDCGGIRNTGLFIIGYSNNNKNIFDLCLLKTWSEYGYGIPIEFGDAPRYYFQDEYAIRLFDPLRLFHTKQEKEDDDNYYYIELMQEIENTKIKPNRDFKNYNQEIIDLKKYPNEYVLIWDPVEGQYESILREKFCIKYDRNNAMFEPNMKVIEWTNTFDEAVKQRKERIENFCCSVCDVLDENLIRKMISFLL